MPLSPILIATMARVSSIFGLGKTQSELDFVDVDVDTDTPLFVDPYALSRRRDVWCKDAHNTLTDYFQRVIAAIKTNRDDDAKELLAYLQEPNETRLGLSQGKPQGAGIGHFQADALFDALKSSAAVKTGLIQSLEECELMIEGIGWDKISDLTTNVIRGHLISYTKDQCALLNIPTQNLALPAFFDRASGTWIEDYHMIPLAAGRPLLLMPKIIARITGAYNSAYYYNHFVLDFLQAQHLEAHTNLVRSLRNGNRVVYKKQLKEEYPFSKHFLFQFSKDNPHVLDQYRTSLIEIEQRNLKASLRNR
jgi:hypothetical protein